MRVSGTRWSSMLVAAVVATLFGAPAAVADAAPAKPRHAWATNVSATWASLRWEPVKGASSYRVYDGRKRLLTTSRAGGTVRGLSPTRNYDLRVRAVAAGVQGPASARIPFTTSARARCHLYAAPWGATGAAGTRGKPIRTVGELARRLRPGRIGCVRGSFRENLTIRRSGKAGRPVVIRNQPGYRATVRGRMWIPKATHDVVIQGLKIDARNASKLPSPTINGARIKFIGNRISNHRASAVCLLAGSVNGYGVARALVLERNRIHKCGKLPANNNQHGIYLENTRNTRVTNNVIVDNANRGIQLYPNAKRTFIARNVIARNGQGIIFSGTDGYVSSRTLVVDNAITHARIRSNVEYWYPPGHKVGKRNYVRRNCVFGARQENITRPAIGFVASGNRAVAPRYVKAKRGNFRMKEPRCARLVGSAAPLKG